MQVGLGLSLTRGGGIAFSPAKVFSGGAAGLWLDPSDLSTGFQLSTGATPQTAAGQPTGRRLDKRLGLTRGSQILTNPGGPFTSTTDWTAQDGSTLLTVDSGSLKVENGAAGIKRAYVAITTVAGMTYEFTASLAAFGGGATGARLCAGTAPTNEGLGVTLQVGTGDARLIFTATGTTTYVQLSNNVSTLGAFSAWSVASCKTLAGNHVTQSTASARPLYDVISSIAADYRDGTDDVYGGTFSAATLTADMDCFLAINRETIDDGAAAFMTGGVNFFGMWETSASRPDNGAGTPTYLVDGVAVTATRTDLKAAVTVGSYVILEIRNLDLSAWTSINFGFLTSYPGGGDLGGVILCPAQSNTIRADLRSWLGNKVGKSL